MVFFPCRPPLFRDPKTAQAHRDRAPGSPQLGAEEAECGGRGGLHQGRRPDRGGGRGVRHASRAGSLTCQLGFDGWFFGGVLMCVLWRGGN